MNATPVYDNVQQEKQRKEQSKNLTYKQSESMKEKETTTSGSVLTGNSPQPVKSMNKFAKPSTFKPQPLQTQPLMKQSASPVQPVQQIETGTPVQPAQAIQPVKPIH